MDGIVHTVHMQVHQVELTPGLIAVTAPHALHLNTGDMLELDSRRPDIDDLHATGVTAMLAGPHLFLVHWLLDRDIDWNAGGAKLVQPHVIVLSVHAC